MGKMIVRECCCGCTLRSGTMAIGIYNTVEAILGIVLYFVLAFSDGTDEGSRNIYIVSAVVCIVEMVVSACLIHGAMKEKKSYVTPWLVITALFLIVYFVILNINLFIIVASGASVVFSVGGLISIALSVYFVIVVYSYHQSFSYCGDAATGVGGAHVIAYSADGPRQYPGHSVVVVHPQDGMFPPTRYPPQNVHAVYPQQGYPYQQEAYPPQPPPYDSAERGFAGHPGMFPRVEESKQQI